MWNSSTKIVRTVTFSIVLLFLANLISVHAQALDAAADLLARINHERIARGLIPYALNADLTAAAQAHANDLAKSGKMRSPDEGHIGADGSTVFDRVARTSYGAYSWGRRLGENWARYRDTATAFSEWMDSTPHRNNILHPLYREVGIGVAPSSLGGFVYIIDFGAQPNVLPIFINNGATETKSANVTITLNDEQVAPNGDNGNAIGHPTQIQIASTADFANAKWQAYAPKIDWTLPGIGKQTIYVKYRDAKGRTATASDSIIWNAPATPSTTVTRANTATPRPSATLTITRAPQPSTTATAPSTDLPTLTPTLVVTPTTTPTAIATIELAPIQNSTTGNGSAMLGALGLATVAGILFAVLKEMVKR